MRYFVFIGLFLISFTATSQVWFEDFTAGADGDMSGNATGTVGGTWSVTTVPGGAFFRIDTGAPFQEFFYIDNTGTEGVWQSNPMNIVTLGEVALELTMGANDATAADYIRAYYKIDGGPEIMFAEVIGSPGLNVATLASAIVSGSTLQIVIRASDNSGGGGALGFDNVTATDIAVLYSIASADWDNGNTWSTTGFAGGSCGCTPDADSRVIIGNGRTVNFTADGTSAGIEIQNTGILQWVGNDNDLTIARGGVVDIQNGGILTRLATTGSSIIFGNYTYGAIIAGSLNIGLMSFNLSTNSTLVNSGTLTLATTLGLVINGGNGYIITNTGTFNLVDMDLNLGDITFNNSGTINQTGNFTGVDAGSVFNNLSNGTWNFGGTTITNVRLFADNNSNTFNYNRAGAQNIITPQDAYSNLTLSGTSAKTALASFSVRGNWARSGTATFTGGANRVTLNGTIAQTIAAVGGETFPNLTISNTFATSPQITLSNPVTISTNLTMTDGNVNLNGNTFRISSSAAGSLSHSQASSAGWMYEGTFTRTFANSTAIAIANVRGFFPLGSSSDWRPFFVGVNSTGGTAGTISAVHTNATTTSTVFFPESIVRRHDAFWSVSTSGISAGTWLLRAGGTNFGTIQDNTDIRMSTSTGVVGTHGAGSGGPADWRVNRTGLTFGQLTNNFHVASTDLLNSPLPIKLAYYRAQIQGDEVISTWKTLQEKNNHFFTVQKTIDFETFYEVGRLDGQGNSQEEHAYSVADNSPFMGISYYRLKQTDFDGAFSFSDPVMINYDGPVNAFLKAYPNPSNGRQITLEIKGLQGIPAVPVHIYNQQGQKVMDIILYEIGPGAIKKEIIFPENLPPGLYIIRAGKTLQLTNKIVVY